MDDLVCVARKPLRFCVCYIYVLLVLQSSLKGKLRELVALLCLSSWCLVIVIWLFLTVSWVDLQCVIVVFPDHTHLLFTCMRTTNAQTSFGISFFFTSEGALFSSQSRSLY